MFVIVVPCFNEEARFQSNAFRIALENDPALNLCLVDDGSTDQTARMLKDFCDQHASRANLLTLETNQGKAEAVRQGLLHVIDGPVDAVAYWDADLATPLEASRQFYELLQQNPQFDIILGSRIRCLGRQVQRSGVRHYVGRVFATLASVALDLPVYDTQCGAKMFRNEAWLHALLAEPFRSRWAFDVELLSRYLIDCKRSGRTVNLFEMPLDRWSEVRGSKLNFGSSIQAGLVVLRLWKDHRNAMRELDRQASP